MSEAKKPSRLEEILAIKVLHIKALTARNKAQIEANKASIASLEHDNAVNEYKLAYLLPIAPLDIDVEISKLEEKKKEG